MLEIFPLSQIHEFCSDTLGIYTIQNYAEIFILSILIYKMLRWLQQDQTKHIILYVYAYTGLIIFSFIFSCTTLFTILCIMMPLATIISIMAHQKQLQKNFVLATCKDITPHTMPIKNWLELIIRGHLLAAYQNKQIFCIIQRNDTLINILESNCNIFVPIQQEITDLIFSSSALNTPSIIWLTSSGIINSVNASWSQTVTSELLHPYNLHHAAITLVTAKTDAVVWSINTETKFAMLWHQGKCLQQITIDQLITSCKQILNKKVPSEKTGVSYVIKNDADRSESKFH